MIMGSLSFGTVYWFSYDVKCGECHQLEDIK